MASVSSCKHHFHLNLTSMVTNDEVCDSLASLLTALKKARVMSVCKASTADFERLDWFNEIVLFNEINERV